MQIRVGPFSYRLELVDGLISHEGVWHLGLCDTTEQIILISKTLPVGKRFSVFWHELAHAWNGELNIHESDTLTEEQMCNLIGLAMAAMTAKTFARLHVYLSWSIDAPRVMMVPDVRHPIPVFDFPGNFTKS